MSTATALIVAAGRGQRFGTERPKQYAPLGGMPVLRHCVLTFLAHPRVDGVRVVIHPDDRNLYDDAVQGLDLAAPVPGGGSRQESVRLGLESLEQTAPDLTLIHDAARPFIDRATIDRVLGALTDRPGAIAALPVVDTLKREEDGRVSRTEDRRGLWRAQTPQGFHFDAILAAHRAASGQTLTDDAAVAERAGLAVALVEGSPANIKVTTQDDLESAERWIRSAQATEMRVGQGFDVHAFGPGDHVMLCGLRIGHDAALVGHSDADVGLHAVTDALLGALGAGDIGSHFPPSDPQWKGANSRIFVSHVCDMIAERGGRITHVDLTLICERPKIGPHREAMRSQLAALLGVSEDRVSVKATTTEKLGFLGRGEGVAAQATATLALPVI